MKIKTILLLILINTLGSCHTSSTIVKIMTQEIDFSHTHIGVLTFTWIWKASFDYYESSLTDLKLKVIFPFAINHSDFSYSVKWILITNKCIISTNLITAIPTLDPTNNNSLDFTMASVNYTPNQIYKTVIKLIDSDNSNSDGLEAITPDHFTSPIKLLIVSKLNVLDYITYAYNNNIGYYHKDLSIASGGFSLDLTPSYSDANLYTFTRDFYGQADINISITGTAKILLRLSAYTFSDDAESTCTTVADASVGIERLENDKFYCQFEDLQKKGLFFIWNETYNPPTNKVFRIRFRVRNPS